MAIDINVVIGVCSTLISLFVVFWCVALWYCRGPCQGERDPKMIPKDSVHENPGNAVKLEDIKTDNVDNSQAKVDMRAVETGSITHIGPA